MADVGAGTGHGHSIDATEAAAEQHPLDDRGALLRRCRIWFVAGLFRLERRLAQGPDVDAGDRLVVEDDARGRIVGPEQATLTPRCWRPTPIRRSTSGGQAAASWT